jgi:hypothetical protein
VGFGVIDATVAQRLEESFMCIAFAGPQPRGVVANRAMPMIPMVTTVMAAAATMRWTRVLSFMPPLSQPMLEKGERDSISYGDAGPFCDEVEA